MQTICTPPGASLLSIRLPFVEPFSWIHTPKALNVWWAKNCPLGGSEWVVEQPKAVSSRLANEQLIKLSWAALVWPQMRLHDRMRLEQSHAPLLSLTSSLWLRRLTLIASRRELV